MQLRFPRPLRPGDVVGVTAPSSGVPESMRARLDVAVSTVRSRGLDVELGDCTDGTRHVSADAPTRAAELQRMLLDPDVRAVVPPWGGETGIDVLRHLDWERLAAAEPTWLVGFSDTSTLLTPLTLRTGWATVHGNNLMDTPYRPPSGLLGWLDLVTLPDGATFSQTSPGAWRSGFVDYVEHPEVDTYDLDRPGGWRRLDAAGDVEVTGRLVGGCVECLAHLAGTPYLDTARLAGLGDGLVVYVEAAEAGPFEICRRLHGMRLAGFFDGAGAVLVGRTGAPDEATLTQDEAVLDAIGDLGVPILADVECGHVAPHLPLVNGALATVRHTQERSEVTQVLA